MLYFLSILHRKILNMQKIYSVLIAVRNFSNRKKNDWCKFKVIYFTNFCKFCGTGKNPDIGYTCMSLIWLREMCILRTVIEDDSRGQFFYKEVWLMICSLTGWILTSFITYSFLTLKVASSFPEYQSSFFIFKFKF